MMRVNGFNKLTLLDYPGHVSVICFVSGCQLRCPFCHNPSLVIFDTDKVSCVPEISEEFIWDHIERRSGFIDGLVMSGGEPLLQDGLEGFLQKARNKGLNIKIDTNGLLPQRLKILISKGLVDHVALDYKSPAGSFDRTTGLKYPGCYPILAEYLDDWRKSLAILRESSISYELRTTIVKELHPPGTIDLMAREIEKGKPEGEKWFLQTYRNTGPVMNDHTHSEVSLSAYTSSEMMEITDKIKGEGRYELRSR
ncbi:MAG: anaerobic ribonucleoside-triphosphate reductase activating protein [Eubacteriales bacterium]|nr:anaerobic ribonucleoside-triphosphate reductase activating protein [Eubacteriales bacterium]MDD4327999.1 anaerobic ribonucleoside-triphosphate reductase activating protein [Eubacteriales bacterium]MDD4717477.1 anaerobic ribonucleoside-triphosphate reductase activating protein [Eubacteriales bacterium]